MKPKTNPIGFRITSNNIKKLEEIKDMIPTINNRNKAMNFIIDSYHREVIIPRQDKIKEIRATMTAYGIVPSELMG